MGAGRHGAYGNFYTLHPDYATCLASGAIGCLPFYASDLPAVSYAVAAQEMIGHALNRLDVTPLDPVWMDNGYPQAFDPRLAASAYIAMVAQELHILSWEVAPQRLPTSQGFHDRLIRRARFINEVLIPNAKAWVSARCLSGPHVPSPDGSPSPLGTRFASGTYHSWYYVGYPPYAHWEDYYDGTWTKNCDYSSSDVQIYWCVSDPPGYPCPQSAPMPSSPAEANPFHAGDDTEQATLERMGLSNWSYQAANLIGLANGAGYEGCYSGGPAPLLPHQTTVAPLTVENCIRAAQANGDNFAQLAPGGCYTGLGIGPLVRIRDARCNAPCTSYVNGTLQQSGEMCGGWGDGTSVYRVASSPNVWVASNVVGGKTSYLGCYRPLGFVTQEFSVGSAEACLNAAVAAKVVYASVEPGGLCRLSNTLLGSEPLAEPSCSASCPATSGQICGGAGAASVFVTNDPLPLTCGSGVADCNGNLTDGCETNITLAANCGACFNTCGSTQYCAANKTCQSSTLVNKAFSLSQALGFTGTSSITGSEGAYTAVSGAMATFSAPAGQDVTLGLDLFAYLPAGPTSMSVDLRFRLDGVPVATRRFGTGSMSSSTKVSGISGGSHTVAVEARSVLNSGPPTTIQLYGNSGGAAQGCFTYGCGPKPANLVAAVVRK